MNAPVLHQIRRRLAGWHGLRVALTALGAAAALALAGVLADAALNLPEAVRAAGLWLPIAAVAALAIAGLLAWRRLTEARVARLFEQSDAALGNRLINAVQLAERTAPDAAGEFFRRAAVELGREASRNLPAWPVVRGPLKRAGILLGAALLGWVLLLAADFDLAETVVPRFLDPHGDHPPYSRLHLKVTADRSEVLYGGQVDVRAVAHGRPVDKLWLVARSGTNETRAIMFLAPDKSFFQTLVNLREATDYYVTDGLARSRRNSVKILYTPQITQVEVGFTYPEYTALPPRKDKLADEPQAVPEDTRVAFRVTSNRPLKSGTLNLTPVLGGKPAAITLLPEMQNTVVTGSFRLGEAVMFDLSVRDIGNLDSAETKRGRFNILPDRPPRLSVLEPGRDAVATPTTRVPVRVQAADDYAVTRMVWLRSLNHSIERPVDLPLTQRKGPQLVEASGAFELDKLGVHPGDVIEYYFEAMDNYPKGPHVTISRPFRLEIISQEQYEQVLRQTAMRKALFEPYFKLNSWMQRLAERSRDVAAKAAKGDPAAKAEAAELAKDLAKYNEELGRLLKSPAMLDVEETFRNTLSAQTSPIADMADQLKELSAGGSGGVMDTNAVKKLSQFLTKLAQTQDAEVGEPARQIASVVQVASRADTFVKLAQQQAVVAQMLRRFSEKTNALSHVEQMEVQELTHQENRIAEAMHDLTSQLPGLLARVPADAAFDPMRAEVNQFLKAVADAKIEENLDNAVKSLEEPDTVTGQTLAQMAAEAMNKLVGKCQGEFGSSACATAHFKPSLTQPGLGSTLEQIMAALKSGNKPGNGQGGSDGYALFNEDVALYGPNMELAGEQAGGEGDTGRSNSQHPSTIAADMPDAAAAQRETPGHVRLQPDARFPLRYRDLIGEYFRVMAESQKEGDQ